MFFDSVRIFIKAGDGGDGVVRFRREKYIPAGGPAGGDGGNGGSIYFEVDRNKSTLIDFKYRRKFVAESGEAGQSSKKNGKDGEDLIIKVPPGTIVKDSETGEVLIDLTHENQRVMIAKGGRGGRGNTHFATATRQAPGFAERGEPGEEITVELELKLIADVGLVGYPNAGKSSLLSVVSAAKPKIANYPFTTLVPNLGVVSLGEDHSFVLADIPGLIEGAHAGVGLGTEFLKHIERTRVLIHVIDASGLEGRDPVEDYYNINKELELYNPSLVKCPQIIAANKMDLPDAEENYLRLVEVAEKEGRQIFPISAATTKGTKELMHAVGQVLAEIKANEEVVPPPVELKIMRPKPRVHVRDFTIRKENEDYVVEGAGLARLMRKIDLNNEEAIKYLQRLFQKIGLYDRLAEMNVPEGATVRVEELEFEYIE